MSGARNLLSLTFWGEKVGFWGKTELVTPCCCHSETARKLKHSHCKMSKFLSLSAHQVSFYYRTQNFPTAEVSDIQEHERDLRMRKCNRNLIVTLCKKGIHFKGSPSWDLKVSVPKLPTCLVECWHGSRMQYASSLVYQSHSHIPQCPFLSRLSFFISPLSLPTFPLLLIKMA